MRKTKIICTIGPASESEERLRELMLAGMNVARFNFSHGTHEEQKAKYERVLKVRKELGLPVATMLDTNMKRTSSTSTPSFARKMFWKVLADTSASRIISATVVWL